MAQLGEIGAGTKCTPEIIDALCAKIAKGVPKMHACALVGINADTLYRWLEIASAEGTPIDSIYRVCSDAVKRAEAAFIESTIDRVASGGRDWAAPMTLGERLQPSVFGRMDRAQIEIRDGRAGGVIIPEPR